MNDFHKSRPEAPGEFFQSLRTSTKMPFQRDAMADTTRVLAASIVLPIICYVLFELRMGNRSSKGIPLPPGPPGLPLLEMRIKCWAKTW
ncbi:uncharacterized protein LAESUDRAFT_728448 [Laetiporus sulphureus 93-53]|uniref:Uncharacterized protein n=1 Tax=Laetiporus sulphureus 93-53 TaxID=1314785 RepID=A0A165D5Y1_9APHY|nr:uncharacterized protein LAESUDRAFT_728448 [Laetiporus sulphureus 93-53]KZT04210.1 hypothetical protein LAESUDRAFT_728448 [Laetiporus sulphureus 93-53]